MYIQIARKVSLPLHATWYGLCHLAETTWHYTLTHRRVEMNKQHRTTATMAQPQQQLLRTDRDEQIDPQIPRRSGHGDPPAAIHDVKYGEDPPEKLQQRQSYDGKQQQRPGGPGAWRPPVAEETTSEDRAAPPATIGDVLEQVGMFSSNEPVGDKDARAIQSAEALATGRAGGVRGGPASEARSAVEHARNAPSAGDPPTFIEVLYDSKARLPCDKIVTQEDAERVKNVEKRADPQGQIQPGHVAATMVEAANYNQAQGYTEA